MRIVRWAGENISPSDDGRLFEKILADGLYGSATISVVGGRLSISALYGVICGRDFTTDAMTISAALPSSGERTGHIYAEINTSLESPLSIKTSISSGWTPTREDINVSGTVAQVEIGTYTATATGVTSARATNIKPFPLQDGIDEIIEDFEDFQDAFTPWRQEVETRVGTLNQTVLGQNFDGSSYGAPLFVYKQYSAGYEITANGNKNISANDLSYTRPTGYTPLSANQVTSGNSNVLIRTIDTSAAGSNPVLAVHNVSGSAVSATASIRILFVNSSVLGAY